jgi:tetratricopeptide (TPR) repeat protein
MNRKGRKDACSAVRAKGIDYVTGLLSVHEAEKIQLHLQTCKSCRQEIKLLQVTDQLSRITERGALEFSDPPASDCVELSDIKLPLKTVKDVISSLHQLDGEIVTDSREKEMQAIKTVTTFLVETDRFLRGKPQFDSGGEWMRFEIRKADLLKEVFKDRIARKFITALKNQADSFLNQGILYQYKGQYDKAGAMLGHAYAIACSVNEQLQGSVAQRLLGEMEFYRGNLETAEILFKESLETARSQGLSEEKCTLLRNLGNISFIQGNMKQSLACLQQALDISSMLEDPVPMARDLNNLASLYFKMGHVGKAIKTGEKALENLRGTSHQRFSGQIHGNLGTFYSVSGQLAEARNHWMKAIRLFTRTDAPEDIAWFYKNLAIVHYKQQNFSDALTALNQSIDAGLSADMELTDLYLLRGRIHRKNNALQDAQKDHALALQRAVITENKLIIQIAKRETAFNRYYSGDVSDAWKHLESSGVTRRMPSEPDSIFKLEDMLDIAMIALKSGKKECAEKNFRKARMLQRKLIKSYDQLNADPKTPERRYLESLLKDKIPNI